MCHCVLIIILPTVANSGTYKSNAKQEPEGEAKVEATGDPQDQRQEKTEVDFKDVGQDEVREARLTTVGEVQPGNVGVAEPSILVRPLARGRMPWIGHAGDLERQPSVHSGQGKTPHLLESGRRQCGKCAANRAGQNVVWGVQGVEPERF